MSIWNACIWHYRIFPGRQLSRCTGNRKWRQLLTPRILSKKRLVSWSHLSARRGKLASCNASMYTQSLKDNFHCSMLYRFNAVALVDSLSRMPDRTCMFGDRMVEKHQVICWHSCSFQLLEKLQVLVQLEADIRNIIVPLKLFTSSNVNKFKLRSSFNCHVANQWRRQKLLPVEAQTEHYNL